MHFMPSYSFLGVSAKPFGCASVFEGNDHQCPSVPSPLKVDMGYTSICILVCVHDVVANTDNGNTSSTCGKQLSLKLLHTTEEIAGSSFKRVEQQRGRHGVERFADDWGLGIPLGGNHQCDRRIYWILQGQRGERYLPSCH